MEFLTDLVDFEERNILKKKNAWLEGLQQSLKISLKFDQPPRLFSLFFKMYSTLVKEVNQLCLEGKSLKVSLNKVYLKYSLKRRMPSISMNGLKTVFYRSYGKGERDCRNKLSQEQKDSMNCALQGFGLADLLWVWSRSRMPWSWHLACHFQTCNWAAFCSDMPMNYL